MIDKQAAIIQTDSGRMRTPVGVPYHVSQESRSGMYHLIFSNDTEPLIGFIHFKKYPGTRIISYPQEVDHSNSRTEGKEEVQDTHLLVVPMMDWSLLNSWTLISVISQALS